MSNNSRTICLNSSFKAECLGTYVKYQSNTNCVHNSRLYSLPFISMPTLKAMDFPGGSCDKESAYKARDLGLIPGLDCFVEKIPHYFGYSRFILNPGN